MNASRKAFYRFHLPSELPCVFVVIRYDEKTYITEESKNDIEIFDLGFCCHLIVFNKFYY